MSKTQKIIAFSGVLILALVGVVMKFFSEKTLAPAEKMDAPSANKAKEQSTDLVAPKDGKVLKTTTSYKNPSGADEVGFSVVVDGGGIIIDAQADILADNRNSRMYQENFSKAFPQALRGKKLSDIGAIDGIGGASLTTKAFNESLGKLRAEL